MRVVQVEWISRDEAETLDFGRRLGRALRPPVWIALMGDLGAGKTRLAQGICEGLEYPGRVRSPTFVLENRYRGRAPIRHQDLYRLEAPDEEMAFEWEDDRESVFLVEWAERAEPEDRPGGRTLEVAIAIDGERRRTLRLSWSESSILGNWDWRGSKTSGGAR